MRLLVESFLPEVVSQANAVRGQGLRFEALIAAGNRGLAEALAQSDGILGPRVGLNIAKHLRLALEKAIPTD
jgi:hypothetical protein